MAYLLYICHVTGKLSAAGGKRRQSMSGLQHLPLHVNLPDPSTLHTDWQAICALRMTYALKTHADWRQLDILCAVHSIL